MPSLLATSDFLIANGLTIAMALGVFGLFVAFYLILKIKAVSPGNAAMQEVAGAIQEGAKAYLGRQVKTISAISIIIFVLLVVWKLNIANPSMAIPIGFVTGAVCSLFAGYVGMRIAVQTNVRTTQAASENETKALRVAFNGGAVTGLLVVGLALVSVGVTYWLLSRGGNKQHAVDSLIGLALGASLISVFARLGGGIYTKAADVGADLVGKVESDLNEDDPRNPATIADNVGDNVGDCAGMAADVFETYAVSLIGSLLITFLQLKDSVALEGAMAYPFVIGGISVIGAVLGILWINIRKGADATRTLVEGVAVSGLISAILYWPATTMLLPETLTIGAKVYSNLQIYGAALVGLFMTGAVVFITNYYTSTNHAPVRKIAKASETGHATNIIAGLVVGNMATAAPVILIAAAIFASYSFGDLFGVATAVMSMLSMAGIIISLDAFGPITDNAGGIAVMAGLPESVRKTTDSLDAVGNTMKAVTKGYAIASAGLAALVLFGSFYLELEKHLSHVAGSIVTLSFSLKDPNVIIGMFIGGLLPFIFCAFAMGAVEKAAAAVVLEVRRQKKERPGIMDGSQKPDYGACVSIVTSAALREMIIPALLPVVAVLAIGSIKALGPEAMGGMLVGTIVTGLFVGISMTSSGGAWDNAKKYIEEGNHGGKHSDAHKASVTGDTVGDPYKDTSGPAINPMIKVVNIVAILVIELFY